LIEAIRFRNENALTPILASASASDRDRALVIALASALAINYIQNLERIREQVNSTHNLDLSGINLSGADLRNLYLLGANLTDTDLTSALVEGTIFGNNPGLTEADKADLKQRGAIFQDPPTSNVRSLVLR
jgi:uncharacterized protein YjbI with pentapeptide repeats